MNANSEFDFVIAEGFARAAKPTTDEREYRAACHPLKTDRCPSIPQLEKIATGRGTLPQTLHANTCAYCRKSLERFREMLGIKPWWQTLQETAQQFAQSLFQFEPLYLADTHGERSVQAKVVFDLTSDPTTINVRDFEFVPGGIWLPVQWQPLMEEIGRSPIELTVVGGNEEQIFGPYLLPGLGAGERQELLVVLPQAVENEWKERIEKTRTLPFNFILRPCVVAEERENSPPSTSS